MPLPADQIIDFATVAAIIGSEGVTHVRTGPNSSTSIATAVVSKTGRRFGEPNVPGYQIDSYTTRFLVSALSPVPKEGDTITRSGGSAYEVTLVEKLNRDTQWKLTCELASINADYAVSIVLKRFTLSTDVAGSVTETPSTIGTYSAVLMAEDDVADMINRLGIKGDKQATTFFMAHAVPVLPMDIITYGGRDYRITMIGDEGRIAKLKKVRVELYA